MRDTREASADNGKCIASRKNSKAHVPAAFFTGKREWHSRDTHGNARPAVSTEDHRRIGELPLNFSYQRCDCKGKERYRDAMKNTWILLHFFSNERLVFSEIYLASHLIRNAIIGILQRCWRKIVAIAKIFDFYQFIWNSWLSSVYLDKDWINCEIIRISQWRLQEVNLYSKN